MDNEIKKTPPEYRELILFLNDIEKNVLNIPNYIKIDVDGIEDLILIGSKNILSNKKIKRLKVLSNDVSKKMNIMMRKVVSEGTAKLVNVEGYQVGGKTGTAEQVSNSIYSKIKNIG